MHVTIASTPPNAHAYIHSDDDKEKEEEEEVQKCINLSQSGLPGETLYGG